MKIGTKGHYAVAAIVELAKHTPFNKPLALKMLAHNQNIPLNYVELLFVKLRQAGLVKSVRGAQGGYLLARGAHDITIWDIVTTVGEGMRINRCKPASIGTSYYCLDNKTQCLMHDMWEGLGNHIRAYLSLISVKDIVEMRPILDPLSLKISCAVPTYYEPQCVEKTHCQHMIKRNEAKKGLCLSRP